jgi:hypothetical protein
MADLWLNHRSDVDFEDFIEYNDIGLPLAYAFAEGLATPTEIGTRFVEETYSLFLEAIEIPDKEYESLDDMFLETAPDEED